MAFATDFPRPTPNPTPGPAPQPPSTSGAKPKPAPKPAATAPATPKPPEAKVIAAKLAAGQTLKAGEAIRSDNGQYELEMQKDGNLVLYDVANGNSLWSSNTSGSGAQAARVDNSGNLQVLKGNDVLWQTKTTDCASTTLTMQDDGNLVLDATTITAGKASQTTALWSSNTAALPVSVAGQGGATQQSSIPTTVPTPAVTFAPGSPELGLKTYTIHNPPRATGTAWSIFENNGVPGLPGTLDQNLAATPYLDRQAFGTRPANPEDAVYKIQNGQQITILDPTRLKYLENERTQLATLDHAKTKDDKTNATITLATTIENELDYAGTQQAVPDAKALGQEILQRAPGDKNFQAAVGTAVGLYQATLTAEGRTTDQLGKIQQAAAKGDWKSVQQLTAQQVAACVGKDTGSSALGDMLGRGGVYATYAGGNPKFAQAVSAGVAQAQQQVLITNPVKQVDTTLKQHGGAAAMALLNKITDPSTAMPGQVAQIMSDPTIQADVKQSLQSANWEDASSKQMMNDLAAACQHSVEADSGTVGTGTQAVKSIANSVIGVYDKMNAQPQLMEDPPFTTQVFTSAASNGNVALALAVATQAVPADRPDIQSSAIDGTRVGMDQFSAHSKDLLNQTDKDAAFFQYGFHDFGGDSTATEQSAYLNKMLVANPKQATLLNNDGNADTAQGETLDGMRTAIAAFSPDLNGVEGFNVNVGNDRYVNPTIQTSSKSILGALSASPTMESTTAAGTAATSSNAPPTNMLWLMRSTRNVAYQTTKGFIIDNPAAISQLSQSSLIPSAIKSKLFSKDGTKLSDTALNVVSRLNNGLSAYLFLDNAQFLAKSFAGEAHNIPNAIQDLSYVGPHGSNGLALALNATMSESMAPIRPNSGATILNRFVSEQQERILSSGLNDSVKTALTGLLGTMTKDTVDFAYFGVDSANAAYYFNQGGSYANYIRGSGDTISALGDAAFLTGAATDAGVIGADGTFLGLAAGAVGWTGVGAALMLVGSGVYTIGNAESHSHAYDGSDQALLEAMGVNSGVAAELAKHSFSFSTTAPSAGPFLTSFFKNQHLSDKDMVNWLNTLTPHQADTMASQIKYSEISFQDDPTYSIQWFQSTLELCGITPPPGTQIADTH
ncbi:hypothetical protein [Trinickia acidisoli]|uniref:hypothetical protein n=1 Tax=Trinickia acidisoli TaxID=2767482 RepID=UPI001A8EAEE9|nr:hypothetical protein [Trinickia acidisoli]